FSLNQAKPWLHPMKLISDVSNVEIVKQPGAIITEGRSYSSSDLPVIKITDSAGNPLSDRIVIAMVAVATNYTLPPFFTLTELQGNGMIKECTNCISNPSDENGM